MHNTYSAVSKVDMSEDIEPVLSKIDVVLTFAIEVIYHLYHAVVVCRCGRTKSRLDEYRDEARD